MAENQKEVLSYFFQKLIFYIVDLFFYVPVFVIAYMFGVSYGMEGVGYSLAIPYYEMPVADTWGIAFDFFVRLMGVYFLLAVVCAVASTVKNCLIAPKFRKPPQDDIIDEK